MEVYARFLQDMKKSRLRFSTLTSILKSNKNTGKENVFMPLNSKQLKTSLLQEFPYRIELHTHTSPVSGCAEIPAVQTVQKYATKGFDGIVITNHMNPDVFRYTPEEWTKHYLSDYYLAVEEGKKCGVKVLLGMEIRFTENNNDYLVYGVDEQFVLDACPLVDKGIEAFYKAFHGDHRVILQAHPCRNGMTYIQPQFLDGIEVFNLHPGHNSRIGMAAQRAKEKEKPVVIAGTDFHHDTHEGLSAIRTRGLPEDSFQLADILKNGDYILEIGDCIILP